MGIGVLAAVGFIVAFSVGSMGYVYRYRGNVRYGSLTEYLRKAWPIFAPLNCLLYMSTQARARKPIIDSADFRELDAIRDNWQAIRDEALALHAAQHFEATRSPGSAASYDVGFRTFFKYGWSKFYLRWYGYTHDSARRLCPRTVAVLEKIPSVNGAMFSILPPGGQLTRHCDPMACSLRYHLGLSTPNSDDCFINIDGVTYSWRDGQTLMFDETYVHYARNDSDRVRVILMCDIDRPVGIVGRVVNFFYKLLMKATVVPNMEGDRRGFANRVFASVAPALARSKQLKQTNPAAYRALKYTVNSVLLLLLAALLGGLFYLLQGAFGLAVGAGS